MAMGKYSSVLRTFITRNFYEDTLAAGTDIVVPVTPYYQPIKDFGIFVNKETNFMVRRTGVFSNFADGLVFKTPADRFDVNYQYTAYRFTGDRFSLNFTYGSKNVTLNAGTTGWVAGNEYDVAVEIDSPDRFMIINVIASDATSGVIQDYWDTKTTFIFCYNCTIAPAVPFTVKNISQLNCMYEANDFAQPFEFSSASEYDLAGVQIKLNIDWTGQSHNTTLLTNTIDPSYNDETVYFDVITEIEFTHQ